MNFSAWSIRNPVPAVLLFILLTVVGLIGFAKLQIQDGSSDVSACCREAPEWCALLIGKFFTDQQLTAMRC